MFTDIKDISILSGDRKKGVRLVICGKNGCLIF